MRIVQRHLLQLSRRVAVCTAPLCSPGALESTDDRRKRLKALADDARQAGEDGPLGGPVALPNPLLMPFSGKETAAPARRASFYRWAEGCWSLGWLLTGNAQHCPPAACPAVAQAHDRFVSATSCFALCSDPMSGFAPAPAPPRIAQPPPGMAQALAPPPPGMARPSAPPPPGMARPLAPPMPLGNPAFAMTRTPPPPSDLPPPSTSLLPGQARPPGLAAPGAIPGHKRPNSFQSGRGRGREWNRTGRGGRGSADSIGATDWKEANHSLE